MGKESRLKNSYKAGETRQQYSNGDRKLYDRNACPDGCDEHVWSVALYFEQQLERLFGASGSAKLPVLYTEIYHQVSSDKDLTRLLDAGRLPSYGGSEGKALVTSATNTLKDFKATINPLLLLEAIVDRYFCNYYSDYLPTINDFTTNFKQLKEEVIAEEYLKYLKDHSTKVPVVTTGLDPKPDRRKDSEIALDNLTRQVYTENQMEDAMGKWTEDHE